MRRRFFLVEMCNRVDPLDDEVWKIRASSKHTAKVIANGSPISNRFRVNRVVPARGGTVADRVLAQCFRQICTKTFP